MKILYVSQYFPPEMGAPAARAAELSKHWARAGHEVTVLTGFPNHPTGVVPENWRPRFRRMHYTEIVDGVRVIRTWLWPLPNRKAHERIRNYASFCASAAISGLALPKPDVLIATSPQLLCALAGWWIAQWKRVPFVFEVRDLWPESLAAVRVGGEGSTLYRVLGAIAGFLYRRAQLIAVVSPAFKEHLILHWGVPAEKIAVVENGVETEMFRPDPNASNLRNTLQLNERFVVCYIGTMGNAHGLETLIAAAEQLAQKMPDAMLLLIGEGAEKQKIVELAGERGLTNVRFLDQQPREEIPTYISAADVCVVMLRNTDLFKTVIPTKLLEYLSCERPVIIAVDGEARRIVEDASAGIFVEPEDGHALADAIMALSKAPERRLQMGINGRKHIICHFSREKKSSEFIKFLDPLVRERQSRD